MSYAANHLTYRILMLLTVHDVYFCYPSPLCYSVYIGALKLLKGSHR